MAGEGEVEEAWNGDWTETSEPRTSNSILGFYRWWSQLIIQNDPLVTLSN